jgi:pimeloyl-ACP methyl ester carboxylesterase
MVSVRTREFVHDGHTLVYDEYGSGPRPMILLPGLLLPRTMHRPLAQALAERGNRVISLDPLGHGESDRPEDMWRYSMSLFAEQVVGLMDHLELDEVVLGGTSLGANVTLETLVLAPDRIRGAVIEMPVLDNALTACAIVFAPMLIAFTFGAPIVRPVTKLVGKVPKGLGNLWDVGVDWIGQDPGPSGALLQGLFFGRIAPPRSERSKIDTRAIVIGHGRDPVHPFSDSDMLVRELRNGRLIEANSLFEMQLKPKRLTDEIARFVDSCWRPERKPATRGRRRATA